MPGLGRDRQARIIICLRSLSIGINVAEKAEPKQTDDLEPEKEDVSRHNGSLRDDPFRQGRGSEQQDDS